ncbi:hypothetical protein [Faecalibacillus intestinalis]|uniref:hypothetical protein n=1 Tax=Faecalibacillus intestinalis TaxID=1982626 RepID=UPI0039945DF9
MIWVFVETKEESKSLENIKTKEVLLLMILKTKSEKIFQNSLFNKIVVFDKTATNERQVFNNSNIDYMNCAF